MQKVEIPREDSNCKRAVDEQMLQRFRVATVASRVDVHAEANEAIRCGQDAVCCQPGGVSHWSDEAPEVEATPDPLPLDTKAK